MHRAVFYIFGAFGFGLRSLSGNWWTPCFILGLNTKLVGFSRY